MIKYFAMINQIMTISKIIQIFCQNNVDGIFYVSRNFKIFHLLRSFVSCNSYGYRRIFLASKVRSQNQFEDGHEIRSKITILENIHFQAKKR